MVIRAAQYLGVAPWELLEQPASWLYWAIEAQGAESQAQARIQARREMMARLRT